MKKIIFSMIALLASASAMAQRGLFITLANGITNAILTEDIQEITFSEDGTTMTLTPIGASAVNFATIDIKDMNYGEMPKNLVVTYNEASAQVLNPYFTMGITPEINGADVVLNNENESKEFTIELTGKTSDGSLVYNADYKTTFVLNGVSITSNTGAAIDIECGKRIQMELKKGTVNELVDAKDGSQKAALYCKGHLEIDKNGTLNVTGNTKHAIAAKEYIQLKKAEGKINILASASDGIHCGQYFLGNGYTVSIDNVAGDGIQAEATEAEEYEEDFPDGSLTIQGGTYNINLTADASVGLKADKDVTINSTKMATSIEINISGNDCKGIKTKGNTSIADDGTIVKVKLESDSWITR